MYFMTIKCLTYELAIVGQALQCDDIITYLLAGLGPEFDSLVSMISHCDNSLILEDIYSMLLTYEAHIKRNNQVFPLANGSANIVTRQPCNIVSAPRGTLCHPFTAPHGSGRGGSTLWCQPCGKPCHTASQCWEHFDPFYLPPPPCMIPQANITRT